MPDQNSKPLTSAEARALLLIYDPIPVVHTSKTGKLIGDEGDTIDERQTVPWTMALGPFGSWFSTVEQAERDFAKYDQWYYGKSLRLGWVVVYKSGWGYQAVEPKEGSNA